MSTYKLIHPTINEFFQCSFEGKGRSDLVDRSSSDFAIISFLLTAALYAFGHEEEE